MSRAKIQVFCDNIKSTKADEISRYCGNNNPEIRQQLIIDHLKSKCADRFSFTSIELDRKNDEEIIESVLQGIHDPSMIKFFKECYSSWSGDGKDVQYVDKGIIPINITRSVKFSSLVTRQYKRIGYYASDTFTPIYEDTYNKLLCCAKNTMSVIDHLCKSDDKIVYALNSMPGHHAGHVNYGGYCYINFAALAARMLSNRGKVLLLDIDYHAADGSFDIFNRFSSENILPASIHIDPILDYPSYEGFASDEKDKFISVPMPKGTNIIDYLKALSKIEDELKSRMFIPDYLVVSFGQDTYAKDPEVSVNGGFALNVDDYTILGKAISKFAPRSLIVQEGGYCLDAIPQIVDNFMCGFYN